MKKTYLCVYDCKGIVFYALTSNYKKVITKFCNGANTTLIFHKVINKDIAKVLISLNPRGSHMNGLFHVINSHLKCRDLKGKAFYDLHFLDRYKKLPDKKFKSIDEIISFGRKWW
jgi:hypothetical protein